MQNWVKLWLYSLTSVASTKGDCLDIWNLSWCYITFKIKKKTRDYGMVEKNWTADRFLINLWSCTETGSLSSVSQKISNLTALTLESYFSFIVIYAHWNFSDMSGW